MCGTLVLLATLAAVGATTALINPLTGKTLEGKDANPFFDTVNTNVQCNWGNSFVPCYDLIHGGLKKHFVAELWAGSPDALGLHELQQGPDKKLWLTHQERDEIIRMDVNPDLFFQEHDIKVFDLGGKDKRDPTKGKGGVHGLEWSKKNKQVAYAACEYEESIKMLTFDKEYNTITKTDKFVLKPPAGNACKKADDSLLGLHSLVEDKNGVIWFTLKFVGCIGYMVPPTAPAAEATFKYFKIPPCVDDPDATPLAFYIDVDAKNRRHIWFNSITTDQIGVLDADNKDVGPKMVEIKPPGWLAKGGMSKEGSKRKFAKTASARPGGLSVLDDGTCLFALYNRFGTVGRVTLDPISFEPSAEEYLFQLPTLGAFLHMQINDPAACTEALGRDAEKKPAGFKGKTKCDLAIVQSTNDFGGEAQANSQRFAKPDEVDRIILVKDTYLYGVTVEKAAEVVGGYREAIPINAPTQKSWIHRVTYIKAPAMTPLGNNYYLAATELRTNRVLVISGEGGPFNLLLAEARDRVVSKNGQTNTKTKASDEENEIVERQIKAVLISGVHDLMTETDPVTDEMTKKAEKSLLKEEASLKTEASVQRLRFAQMEKAQQLRSPDDFFSRSREISGQTIVPVAFHTCK